MVCIEKLFDTVIAKKSDNAALKAYTKFDINSDQALTFMPRGTLSQL